MDGRFDAPDARGDTDRRGGPAAEQVAELAGSVAGNRRATAHRWREQGAIFAVEHQQRSLYPSFEFDVGTGRPKPVIRSILAELPPALVEAGWQLAFWFTTPADMLHGCRPVDVLDADPDAVIDAAGRAPRLGRCRRVGGDRASPRLGVSGGGAGPLPEPGSRSELRAGAVRSTWPAGHEITRAHSHAFGSVQLDARSDVDHRFSPLRLGAGASSGARAGARGWCPGWCPG